VVYVGKTRATVEFGERGGWGGFGVRVGGSEGGLMRVVCVGVHVANSECGMCGAGVSEQPRFDFAAVTDIEFYIYGLSQPTCRAMRKTR